MAIAVLFEFPGQSIDVYDRINAENPVTADQPARTSHVCFKTQDGWGVFDVWDSAEAFEAFGAVIGPILAEHGISATPQIHEVHNTM